MPTRREFLQRTASAGVLVAACTTAKVETQAQLSSKTTFKTTSIPNTDLVVSRVAYGTGFLDLSWKEDPDFTSKAKQAIRVALENEINFFDMADVYAQGRSEAALGEVFKESPTLRDQIVIQSKCGLRIPNNWAPGTPLLGVDISAAHILRSVEGSLKRLRTDRLDILLLHAPDTLFQPEEIAQAFDELNSSGKVRYFGVSNFGIAHMELLRKHLRSPLVVNQVALGLGYCAPLAVGPDGSTGGIVDYCRLRDIQVQAHSPLRGGLLKPPNDASPKLKDLAQRLVDLAAQKNTNPSAIALAWLLFHPARIVTIIGSSKPQYIVENCAADRVEISHDEWHTLFRLAADIQPGKSAGTQ